MIRILAGLLAAAVMLAGLQTWRIDRIKANLSEAREEAAGLAQRLERADTAAEAAQTACEAREANARQSARAIERIITREVHVDRQGCPVRGIVGPDELRQALTPGALAAEPVHHGAESAAPSR